MGLQQPLPIGKSHWSQISIDLIPDVPVPGCCHKLYSNVCLPHDNESTLVSLQKKNRRPGCCAHIHRQHRPSIGSTSSGCIRLWFTLHSRWLETRCEDSVNEAAHVNGVPSRTRWAPWELEHNGCMLFAWLCHSQYIQLGRLPPTARVCFQFLSTLLNETDAF
jgi:hypothetical protein